MPPRARKTAAKKPPPEETPTVTDENTEPMPPESDESTDDQPKRRGGRKRSELAHAARAYEQADDAVHRLETRYQNMAVKLSEIGAKLALARQTRDESWAVIEAAREARVPEDAPADESDSDESSDDE